MARLNQIVDDKPLHSGTLIYLTYIALDAIHTISMI